MRSMLWLRVFALGANLCFIAYGAAAGLKPVLVLHLLLLPCNLIRLKQYLADLRRRSSVHGQTMRAVLWRESRHAAEQFRAGGRDWLVLPDELAGLHGAWPFGPVLGRTGECSNVQPASRRPPEGER